MEYEELKSLPVLDSVIRETLRIHPPIHSIMRAVREDVVVPPTLAAPSEDGRYVIPKGHVVMSSAAVSQVDPSLWKNAREWDPTRWSDPEGAAAQAYKQYDDVNGAKVDFGFGMVSKGTESPYQPFGAGRHRCIGEQVSTFSLFEGSVTDASPVCICSARHDHLYPRPSSRDQAPGDWHARTELPRKLKASFDCEAI